MIEPKPLTEERRAAAELLRGLLSYRYNASIDTYINQPERIVRDLLAAETYWRMAVKNSEEWPSDQCAFCEAEPYGVGHKPGCPWILARQETA